MGTTRRTNSTSNMSSSSDGGSASPRSFEGSGMGELSGYGGTVPPGAQHFGPVTGSTFMSSSPFSGMTNSPLGAAGIPSVPNGMVADYQNLTNAFKAAGEAYAAMFKEAKHIPWGEWGTEAGNAAAGYNSLALALGAVKIEIQAIAGEKDLIKSMQLLNSAMPMTAGSGIRNLRKTIKDKEQELDDPRVTYRTNKGFTAPSIQGIGVQSPEGAFMYDEMLARLKRVASTGRRTQSIETYNTSKAEYENLQKLLPALQREAERTEGRMGVALRLSVPKLANDINVGAERNLTKIIAPGKGAAVSSDFGSMFGSANAYIQNFKSGNAGALDEGEVWRQRAILQNEADLKNKAISQARYTKNSVTLDTMGNRFQALRNGGVVAPVDAEYNGALSSSAAVRRNALITGQVDSGAYDAARAGILGQITAKAGDEKSLSKLTSELRQLQSLSKEGGDAMGGLMSKLGGVAGMAIGIYSLSQAFSMAISKAIEFDGALKRVEAAVSRMPNVGDRRATLGTIRSNAVGDALSYGSDIGQALELQTTAIMGSTGSLQERGRLGRTMAQLAFTTPTQMQEYQGMIAPLTGAGLGAADINQFFQTSQVAQGRLNLTPERMRGFLTSVANNASSMSSNGLDWDTVQALGYQEASATNDSVARSRINRIQTSLRSSKNVDKIQNILSRGNTRTQINGEDIAAFTTDTNAMLSVDKISNLYRAGHINDQEVTALAQTLDNRSPGGTMAMLKTGLDGYRDQVHADQATAALGYVSTDKMAEEQGKSLGASINRIQQSMGVLAVSGIDPLGRSVRAVAAMFTAIADSPLGKAVNLLASTVMAAAIGIAASKGIGMASSAIAGAAGVGGTLLTGARALLSSTGGLVGLGVGAALTVGMMGYDAYKEHHDAQIDATNAIGSQNVESTQRSLDAPQKLIKLMQDLREADENGTLTAERRKIIENDISKIVGHRISLEGKIQEILSGQTGELAQQLSILNQMGGRTRDSRLITAAMNIGIAGQAGAKDTEGQNHQTTIIKGVVAALADPNHSTDYRAIENLPVITMMNHGMQQKVMPFSEASKLWREDDPSGSKTGVSTGALVRAWESSSFSGNANLRNTLAMTGGGAVAKDAKEARAGYGAAQRLLTGQSSADFFTTLGAKLLKGDAASILDSSRADIHKQLNNEFINPGSPGVNTVMESFSKELSDKQAKALGASGRYNIDTAAAAFSASLDKEAMAASGYHGDPTNAAAAALWYKNNPNQRKLLPADAQGALNDYFTAEKISTRGTVASSQDTKVPHFTPKFISQAAFKDLGDFHKTAQYGDFGWYQELATKFDGNGYNFNGTKMSWKQIETHDLDQINQKYDHLGRADKKGERKDEYANAKAVEIQEKKEDLRRLQAEMKRVPQTEYQTRAGLLSTAVKDATFLTHGNLTAQYAGDLASGDSFKAGLAQQIIEHQLATAEYNAAAGAGSLGMSDQERRSHLGIAGAKVSSSLSRLRATEVGTRSSLVDMQNWKAGAFAKPIGLFDGQSAQNSQESKIITDEITRYKDLLSDKNLQLEDSIKINKQIYDLEKKKVDLDESVIRARKAAGVGHEVQGQFVDIMSDMSQGGTLNRGKNMANLGQSLGQRAMSDNIKRALDQNGSPIAKLASFIYDPGGTMDAKYAQEKLTNATLYLAARIDTLTSILSDRVASAGAAVDGGSSPAGSFSGSGMSLSPEGYVKPDLTIPGMSKSVAPGKGGMTPASHGGSSQPGAGGSAGSSMVIALGQDPAAAFDSNPELATATLKGMGIEPANGKTFTADEVVAKKGEIKKAQALQQQARNNPYSAATNGAQFGAGFWANGGLGRSGIKGEGWFSSKGHIENTLGADGQVNGTQTVGATEGMSNTGAAVGGATAIMAGLQARAANRDNGAGARDKATAGATLMAAGATVAMIPGYGWIVGGIMMVAGAVLNSMASADAAENNAKKKDEAYAKQLAEYQRGIAIQEEQKKAIGLMAERVLSIRGDVGNTFEGVASSAFLSGRWAGRANIQVANLTVVANDPASLSQALTAALTTQARQGVA